MRELHMLIPDAQPVHVGSTAFPKPIKFLDKNFRKWGPFVCMLSFTRI